MSTAEMLQQPLGDQRYHSLDGLRASMMLLGIVLHAAWFFCPVWFGHPITDVSANWGIAHFFYWVHLFRMQAFFLVAGFFAHLLIQKRGVWRFVGNRLLRIAVPFVLFTSLLYPLMVYQSVAGGLLSGRIQSSKSTWSLFVEEMTRLNVGEVWPIHFWFLYCLLLLYGISLLIGVLFRWGVDRRGDLRHRVQDAVGRVVSAPWGTPLLAVPVAVLMYCGVDWFGIDCGPMKPRWSGVFAYWVFFAIGWCLHAQPTLLLSFNRGWSWRLAVGTALGLLLSVLFYDQLVTGRMSYFYPMVADTEVQDYRLFQQRLVESGEPEAEPLLAYVREKMSPEYRQFVAEVDSPTSDQLAGITFELSMKAVVDPDLAEHAGTLLASVPPESRTVLDLPSEQRAMPAVMALNRKLIESAFAPAIASFWHAPRWYRAAYFYVYALCSWLLVFGCLGLFNRVCSNPSRVFRYLADASYWLYIVHLPLQFQLQLWIAPWQIHWLPKVALYVAYPMVVGLLSYHLLVRSTYIGWLLNGRRYPFVLGMLRGGRRDGQPVQSPSVALEPEM